MKPCIDKRPRDILTDTEATHSSKILNLALNDNYGPDDRISKLPDNLIGHVLSFLPTKHAVGTSVLSTSWEKLWTSINNFHFDDQLLFDPQNYHVDNSLPFDEFRQEHVLCRSNFMHVVDQVFSQTKGSVLSSFYMRIRYTIEKEEFEHLNEWLHEALHRGVRQIDVKVPCYYVVHDMLRTLFLNLVSCTNLEVLKLGEAFILDIPQYVCLPNLKVLQLSRMKISGNTVNKLISSCPRLEDLSLELVWLTDMTDLNVSASVLKNLVLYIIPLEKGFKIVLDTPRLTFFNFCDRSCHSNYSDLSFKCPHSIVKAQIELTDYDDRPPEPVIYLLYRTAERIQILYLPYDTLKAFSCCDHRMWPQFLSLTYLEFLDTVCFDSISLGSLLNSAQNLQTLVFKEGFFSAEYGLNWFRAEWLWFKTENTPAYFSCLKIISIGSFKGNETEIEGLYYLLKKAIVLEKLEICYSSMVDKRECLSLTEKLLLTLPFPKSCELVVL